MPAPVNQNLILIEGAATYERILADLRGVETDESIRHIQDFLKIYPEFAPAHNDAAVLYYQAGNALKALAHYEKAHKLEPANVTYRKNLADFYFVELEWTGEAIHTYLDILKDNPFDVEALNALGTMSLRIGRKEQARQYFSRTLQLDTENSDARQALQELGVPLLAATKPPQPPPALFAPAVEQKTTIAEPLPSFRDPQPASARSPEELYREAIDMANAGNADDAIRLLERLVQNHAGYAPAHNDLGVLYQKRGKLQDSRCHHEQAVRLQPDNVVFQKNLADLLAVGFSEFEKALKMYVNLQAKAPNDIEVLKAIASICQRVGKPADACFFLKRALALQPWDREIKEALNLMESAELR